MDGKYGFVMCLHVVRKIVSRSNDNDCLAKYCLTYERLPSAVYKKPYRPC